MDKVKVIFKDLEKNKAIRMEEYAEDDLSIILNSDITSIENNIYSIESTTLNETQSEKTLEVNVKNLSKNNYSD